MAFLVSVNVGMPKDVEWHGKTVHTGIWKHSVRGPRMVRRLNIDGDGQGDTAGHGGEQRAVLVYQLDSYAYWKSHLGRDDFVYGQFGENLTVDGLLDDEVCIGDRYRIGEAEFEVTQPRVTCYRVGIRLNQADMPNLLVGHHRPGFYMRVIAEGHIEAGDQIVKTATPRHQITIAATNALLYLPDRDLDLMRKALDIPALSPGWQGSFHDFVAAADSATDSAAPTAPPPATRGWPGFRPLRVARVVQESDTIASIYLLADDGQPLPAARGGQYLALRVPGVGQPAPVRSYSLSSAPGAGTYRLSIKRDDHGLVSNYLHTQLHVGAVLDAAAPRGAFVLDDSDSPVLLISAGVGVTPVLAMLHQLAAQHSQREVWWIHGSRGPREHALAAEAHQLLTSLPHAHEHVYYSAAGPPLLAATHATSGRLSAEAITALDPPADAHAYLCGPSGFMTDVQSALNAAGIDPRNIHIEIFGTLSAINPGITNPSAVTPHLPPGQPGSGPTITFARSDLSVPFDTAVASVLEMAELCDVPTRWACRTGVCHTCATQLLSGEVTYSPEPLERPIAGEALICCSRPATDLVLDM